METRINLFSSNKNTARLAGLLYLIMVIGGFIAEFIRSGLIVAGDGAATVSNILASGSLFRISFMSDLAWITFYLLAAWALYVLLKPVNGDLALLFVLLATAGVSILFLNTLNEFAVLLLLGGSGYAAAFNSAQLQALVMFFLDLHSYGYYIAQVCFSLWLLPLGYLVYKSGFFPRILGILLVLGGAGLLIEFLQHFLLPGYELFTYPGLAIATVAEYGFCLWLLVKGAKDRATARDNDLQAASGC